jgi:hypothetical protein
VFSDLGSGSAIRRSAALRLAFKSLRAKDIASEVKRVSACDIGESQLL